MNIIKGNEWRQQHNNNRLESSTISSVEGRWESKFSQMIGNSLNRRQINGNMPAKFSDESVFCNKFSFSRSSQSSIISALKPIKAFCSWQCRVRGWAKGGSWKHAGLCSTLLRLLQFQLTILFHFKWCDLIERIDRTESHWARAMRFGFSSWIPWQQAESER